MKSGNPFYRWSIRTKTVLLIIGVSVIFGSGVLAFIYFQMQNTLRDAAITKTRLVAEGLSVKAVVPVQVEDLNALQSIQREAVSRPDVAYCFIRDGRGKVLTSSFEGNALPPALQTNNILNPGMPFGAQPAIIPVKDNIIDVIDIASPIAGGTLGTVHVGLNRARIKPAGGMLLLYGMEVGIVMLIMASLVAVLISAIVIAPIKDLMAVAESLGNGDLSKKVNVRTGDELGRLGEILNRTGDQLQALARTASDQDTMQRRAADLLAVVSTAAKGDLTVRAEVTADTLGSVADSLNLLITNHRMLVTYASNVAAEIQRSPSGMPLSSDSGDHSRHLADVTKRLTDTIGRYKFGKEQMTGETPLPPLEGHAPVEEDVTTSDEDIKIGFIE